MIIKADPQAYVDELLREIERRRKAGAKSIYRVSDPITVQVANAVERYFTTNEGYRLEMRKCARCKNEWDIIIYFD